MPHPSAGLRLHSGDADLHLLPSLIDHVNASFVSLALVTLVTVLALPAVAQEPAPEEPAPDYSELTVPLPGEGESVRDFRVVVGGVDATGFASQSRAELEVAVAPMPLDEIDARADAAMEYLTTVSTALGSVLVRYQREQARDLNAPSLNELRERAELIAAFKKDLIARTNILLEAAELKGADKTQAHKYVDVVAAFRVPDPIESSEPTADQLARDAVRRVREEPPVHDRAEPWTASVEELKLELQPLQREQIEERVSKWLNILQREVRERIRMDLALKKTEDQSQRESLATMVNNQQEVISATVERLQAVLAVLAKRGGDVTEAQRYITNATGQRVDFTNPSVFYAQAKAWLLSPGGGLKLGVNVLKFLGILVVFWFISGIVGAVIAAALSRLPRASNLLHKFLVGGSRRVVMAIGVLMAISAVGISITPLAAAIGAAGLVIGLALQGTLSNFASGILILIYRPFDVGDVINAGGVFGKVDAMTLVSTRILTFDNQVNVVPNNSIWNGVITNATALDTRRVDMTFGIGYGDDMDHAQGIIEEVVTEHPMVLKDPAPTIKMSELADSSVNFIVRPWAKTSQYWDVYWDVTKRVKERFDAEGINIPFPQRDLHLAGPIEVVMGGASSKKAEPPPPPAPSGPIHDDSSPSTSEPGPAD
ncbi:MAG: mechanosensitive ion channel domain-containing protein [Pseudomonadota bacterium]